KMTDVVSPLPTFTDTPVTVSAYTAPPAAEQKDGEPIESNDARILNAEWRRFADGTQRLVAAQAVGTGDGDAHARWYQFGTAGPAPTLTQQGTLDPGAEIDTYFPSVALAASGNIG